MKINSIINSRLFSWILFIGLGCSIYIHLLLSQDAINPDAQIIIPHIESFDRLVDYLKALLSFKTFDIQPLRDLSLWLDIKIYHSLGYNSFVLHNLLIWILIVHQVTQIIRTSSLQIDSVKITLIGAGFLVYPLFSQAVSWGMARKHLLSIYFILLATKFILEKNRTPYRIVFFYLLSVLSHPIALGWPLWATCYQWLNKDRNIRSWTPLFIVLALMLVMFGVTYSYYDSSQLFKNFFGERTVEIFNLPDKVLSLGHYSFQIFFPYLLSYRYFLGHWSSLIGLAFMVIFLCFLYARKVPRSDIIHWGLFILLPLGMVTAKSDVFYDTYTILPSIGVLFLVIKAIEKIRPSHIKLLLIPTIIIWSYVSHVNAERWRDEVTLARVGFENRPTCDTAFDYLKISYENSKPPENKLAKDLVITHNCKSSVLAPENVLVVKAFILYYDETMSRELKIQYLTAYSQKTLLPKMILVAELIKQKLFKEADVQILQMTHQWGNILFPDQYVPIVAKVLKPYCEERTNQKCLAFINPFSKKKDKFYYK